MPADLPKLPARPADGHKGTFGRVLVVGGSADMLGAPILAATAAYRVGAGWVQAAMPAAMLPAALSVRPEVVGLALAEDDASENDRKLLDAAEAADVLVVGPGLGALPHAVKRLAALVRLSKPAVLDADALNILAAGDAWPKDFALSAVLTPHPGEMQRLGRLFGDVQIHKDDARRLDQATAAAKTFGCVVLLKGRRTVIAEAGRHAFNGTGSVALAKAGTGDVLSGTIGGLLAQGMAPFEAAVLGAHLHGLAGEIAAERHGVRSVLATEVAEALSEAIRAVEAA